MKMLIAVTIFGILTNSFAEVYFENRNCHRNAMADFKLDQYLKIQHAYVTHVKDGVNSQFCREVNTTKQSDGSIKTITESYDELFGETLHYKMYCNGNQTNGKKGEFFFRLQQCKRPKRKSE
uniref:Putative triabin n=1 Tax=Panstrongylus lignarius TaxID=156445 RepID=A0A224XTD5_9HEMI